MPDCYCISPQYSLTGHSRPCNSCSEYTARYSPQDRRNRQRAPPFSDWLEDRVRDMSRAGLSPSADLITMSRLPSPILKHHSSMWAYGYHFWAEEEDGASFVSFDGGVAAIITQTCVSSRADQNPVDAELLYVGIIKDILEVDYGHIKRNVLKCSWIKPHLRGEPTIRRDADGFWSVKYASRQAAGVEPYLQPLHARQVPRTIRTHLHSLEASLSRIDCQAS